MACAALRAQDVYVSVQANGSKVMVKGRMQLSATITDINGTPLDPGTLSWSSSDNALASVNDSGMVTGLLPGTVRVGVTDRNTGAVASTVLHIVPASFTFSRKSPISGPNERPLHRQRDEKGTEPSGSTGAAPSTSTDTGATGTTGTDSGGASAPAQDDSASNDTAPPAGSDAEQFEDFCAQNPGAC